MAEISAYARKQVLDWLLGGVASPTGPSAQYLGLATGSPTYTGASECADVGYARQTILFNAGSTYASGASVSNTAAMTFGPFSSFNTVSGYQIWDAVTGGNMWWYDIFGAGIIANVGQEIGVAAGSINLNVPATTGMMPYAAKLVLDWICGGATPTRPAGRWLSIASGAPNSVGASDGQLTWSGNAGSLRATMSFSAAVSPSGIVSNASAASFGQIATVTALASGWNLYDANAAGNRLMFGALTAAATARTASFITVAAAGGIKISLA